MNTLTAASLAIGFPGRVLARDISFALQVGEVVAVLGRNGSGKTTLFRTLLGLLPAVAGEVQIGEHKVIDMASREVASAVAYVPQISASAFDFTVLEMVTMARVAHVAWYARPGKRDRDRAHEALHIVGMSAFASRRYIELSGGERQLVMIARALATEAQTILLDEPTASLDFGNQLLVLETLAMLKSGGFAILFTTHHPEQALRLAQRTMAIDRGGKVMIGETTTLLTREFVAGLYGVSVGALNQPTFESTR